MIPDIEKYYTVAGWTAFRKEKKVEKQYLSLLKSVLKDMKITFETTNCRIKVAEKVISHSIYRITSNIDLYL